MNLGFYMEKMHSSDEFKDFSEKNPSAYLCSSFFVIDKENKENRVHFDYINPKNKKISSFQIDKEIKMVELEKEVSKSIYEAISDSIEVDFDELEEIIGLEMEKNNVKNKMQKIMLSLQKNNGKAQLAGTVFISSLGMIKISIILPEKKVTEFEKRSLFDMIRVFKK